MVFFSSLIWLINTICFILYIALILRIIISWVDANPYNEIVQLIYSVTEPILAPFRMLPLQFGGIDFSPILAFFALRIVNSLLVWAVVQVAGLFMR